jgi:hypothetical protein
MEEPAVRDRAEALCAALVAGDVGRATVDFSQELQRNLGEVVALLPLPAIEATVDSIERGGSGFIVILRLVGETEEVLLQTRWKERGDRPTVIELSHLSKTETVQSVAPEGEGEGGAETTG